MAAPVPIFNLGGVKFSPGLLDKLAKKELVIETVLAAMAKHRAADWGDVSQSQKDKNDEALGSGGHLESGFNMPGIGLVKVLTDGEHLNTSMSLPNEHLAIGASA